MSLLLLNDRSKSPEKKGLMEKRAIIKRWILKIYNRLMIELFPSFNNVEDDDMTAISAMSNTDSIPSATPMNPNSDDENDIPRIDNERCQTPKPKHMNPPLPYDSDDENVKEPKPDDENDNELCQTPEPKPVHQIEEEPLETTHSFIRILTIHRRHTCPNITRSRRCYF